jgi:hypothetical protein
LYFAPDYLVFSKKPAKSDAVILLIGPNYDVRRREAERLIAERYADYLIIPGFNQISRAELGRSLTKVLPLYLRPAMAYKTSKLIENTHLEVAHARRIMDGLGCTSAIFVSSPYHMRRIKIIAEKVFTHADNKNLPAFELYYAPSRYETPRFHYWSLNADDLRFVASEYAKIVWFFIYSSFPNTFSNSLVATFGFLHH